VSPPDPFAPTPLFAFPLFSSVIVGFEAHREPLLHEILALRRAHPGVVRSNRGAWHSGPELLAEPSEHLAWLLQKVLKFSRHVLGRYYRDWADADLVLASCWANVLEKGGWNAPHHHFPCHWSGVYYVSLGRLGTSREDPGGLLEFVHPTPWLGHSGLAGNHVHVPKEGLTLLFPATLNHFVHPHADDEPRVSIAYNLQVSPRGAPPEGGP
jgi:uncharacterized protein (TIGR02466 family)